MAIKTAAQAYKTGGSGNVPGYGKVTNKKPSAWAGGMGNSIQSSLAQAFKPQTPAYKPPAAKTPAGGGGTPGFDINNLPVDPTYDAQIGGFTKTRDNTLAGLKANRESTKLNYGYTESGDPTNPTLTFDPSNPNSVAAQMKKRYDQSKVANVNSFAARGQFGGALSNAQGAADSSYSTSSDSLQKKLIDFLQQNTRDQGQAQTDFETNSGTAYGDRVSRALAGSAQNTSAPTSSSSPSVNGQQVDLSKWVKTAYKNSAGHDVQVRGDGSKWVSADGGKTWKRV